jgi:hypothetical protein
MQGPPRRLAPRRPGFVSRAPASLATVRTLVAPGVAGRVNPRDCRLTPRRPEFVSCTLASLASKRAFEAPMVAEGVIPRDCQRELRRPEVAWESPRAAMVRTMLARIRVPRTCLSRHGEGLGGGRRLLEGQQAPAAPLRAAGGRAGHPACWGKHGGGACVLGHTRASSDRACCSVTNGGARVPEVLAPTKLEGLVTGMIIAHPREPAGGPAVSDDVEEPQEFAMQPTGRR